MRTWLFPVPLDSRDTPLFLQIARAISDDVVRGRLRPGGALPGSRTLAATLAVHRTTVVAAYEELAAQGWVTTRPGGATLVAATLPDPQPRRFAARARLRAGVPAHLGFDLEPAAPEPMPTATPPGALTLWGGVPDLRLVPRDALARAWRRAARGPVSLAGYARDGRGDPRLRAGLAELVSTARGLAAMADDVLVVRGSQMALYLAARVLVRPGDAVAVENPGYAPARRAFARAGARLVPVPVDRDGIDVAALADLVARAPLRLVHVTPHHQYPTTVTLSASRRLALLELARRARFALIEDDYDHEFHYDGRPVLPLASADAHGVVVYVGTLAKVLAPTLRLGYVVAPRALLDRMTAERSLIDWHGDQLLERAVAELIEDGELQRHVRRLRRIYQRRRDALCAALEQRLAGALTYTRPAGGMALWARAARGLDVDTWAARARDAGLVFQTGRTFTVDGRATPHVRLGFAVANERELAQAAAILSRTLPARARRA
jgi:GntR family transcriptional regulator / MocR family aminotransferase